MKITKRQLKRIIREEKVRLLREEGEVNGQAHHYPTLGAEWETAASNLAGDWIEVENKAFDTGDPLMMGNAETAKEAGEYWEAQVEAAAEELEERLVERVRILAMQVMEEISNELIDGQFA